jgi:hypothetical protein
VNDTEADPNCRFCDETFTAAGDRGVPIAKPGLYRTTPTTGETGIVANWVSMLSLRKSQLRPRLARTVMKYLLISWVFLLESGAGLDSTSRVYKSGVVQLGIKT